MKGHIMSTWIWVVLALGVVLLAVAALLVSRRRGRRGGVIAARVAGPGTTSGGAVNADGRESS
jgi:hypothetical protein